VVRGYGGGVVTDESSPLRCDAPSAQVTCPHCKERFAVEMTARLRQQSMMSVKFSPRNGERFSAAHIGGSLRSMDRLLTAIGRDYGVHTTVGIDRVVTEEDGSLRFDFLLARTKEPMSAGEHTTEGSVSND
jgi:hypothetical protein